MMENTALDKWMCSWITRGCLTMCGGDTDVCYQVNDANNHIINNIIRNTNCKIFARLSLFVREFVKVYGISARFSDEQVHEPVTEWLLLLVRHRCVRLCVAAANGCHLITQLCRQLWFVKICANGAFTSTFSDSTIQHHVTHWDGLTV